MVNNHPHRSRKIATSVTEEYHSVDYAAMLGSIQNTFNNRQGPVFQVDTDDLWETFLDALPFDRQYHNCRACRSFVEHFGGLVWINDYGKTVSAVWPLDNVPSFYLPAFKMLRSRVEQRRILRPFYTRNSVLGTPKTGLWDHMVLRKATVHMNKLLTPDQMAAAKVQDYETVKRAMSEFSLTQLHAALSILQKDEVNRAEKFVGPVQWLIDLKTVLDDAHANKVKQYNYLWKAVAVAPDGYCHPRSSVVGSLLEDVQRGIPLDTIRKKFNAKVHGLVYQRPQTAPAAQTVEQAEKIVEKLGLARSLRRRFARLEDVEKIWLRHSRIDSALTGQQTTGVFSGIRTKDTPKSSIHLGNNQVVTMTWVKFKERILPTTKQIQAMVPSSGHFIALTTAVHADAEPILKWDTPEWRYPVAWYVYTGLTFASQWNLKAGWCNVEAISPLPSVCGPDPKPHLGDGVVLILQEARDLENRSSALFPECMRSEFHGVRSVIEAYSKANKLSGLAEASACGLDFRATSGSRPINIGLRVLDQYGWSHYHIDRWD